VSTGLVVIDLQRAMFEAGFTPHDGEGLLERVSALIARARRDGVPVIYVQHDGGAGDPLQHGLPGWEIHPAIAPEPGELVVEKTRCSAFYRTRFDELLKQAGIDRLVVAGMQTEYCVDTTCRAAADLGYEVVLVEDGHSTYDSEALPAAKIVAHHNQTLSGSFVALAKSDAVTF
jgi:nicotinamidase-related amidase